MANQITFRHPNKNDTREIFVLIKNSKPLDLNSEYLYLLQTTYFSNTCMVAERKNKIIGFVSGFIDPKDKDIFFIWQVAVDNSVRGCGVGFGMLKALFASKNIVHTKCIHTTISPSNISSQKLFEKFANELNFDKEISIFATKDDFKEAHEDELLYKFKPIKGGNYENIRNL
ncbi:MAG: diaminobutyrate acetyltransferase [Sulfurovaceae bacterium]|nr:diaminobutyrate acetyltransferase [Sulfurovaceae bacterium]MDD5548453.1 diaminobutyrate acetyltransferase [Sulfurovaceae bacterium]